MALLQAATDLQWWTGLLDTPSRVMAPVGYYGGKGHLARRIIRLLPPGRVYVEPYAGVASVFWHLPRPYEVEVLNDLDERIVGLFRVLQDPRMFEEFSHRIYWTPYSRSEFVRAIDILRSGGGHSPVTQAWALYVVCNQGVSGRAYRVPPGSWGRAFVSTRGMAMTASRWRSRMTQLRRWHERLTRVQLDCRDALEIVRYWDSPDTVFYIDPPYILGARASLGVYRHEQDDDHHRELVSVLLGLRGAAVVSGYDSDIYRPLDEAGWERYEVKTTASAAVRWRGSGLQGAGRLLERAPRTEVIWRKPVGGQQRLL